MLSWPRVQIANVDAVTSVLEACASSSPIALGFERYGLEQQRATCVGDRLQRNLSIGQLQQLGRAAKASNTSEVPPARQTAGDLLSASAQINDFKVPFEVARANMASGVLTGTSLVTPS